MRVSGIICENSAVAWTRILSRLILAVSILLASNGLAGADPEVLWRIVNDQCVPHQRASGDPAPCALVNQDGDFALLKDNDGDLENDIAFSYVFSEPRDGQQTVDVYLAAHADAESASKPSANRLLERPRLLRRRRAPHRDVRRLHVLRRCSQRRVLLRLRRGQEPLRHFGRPQLHRADLPGESPWTGVDSNIQANVFATAIEMPTSFLGATPTSGSGGDASAPHGELLHVDSAGHPSVSSFFNTDDTKEEYNASEPARDRERWIGMFIDLLGHTGGYTREEAIRAIDNEGTLPDMLAFNPSKPAKYPNGRVFTDGFIDYRLAILTKGECPPSG